LIDVVGEAMVFRPQLRTAFVVNRRVVRTIVGREARAALGEQRFPTLDTEVHQRTVFAGSVADGRLVTEDQPRGLAATEIGRLAREIAAFAA
jgi:chromosome partitioning protein